MSSHAVVHAPVGGRIMTRPFMVLLAIAAVGAITAAYRFVNGIGSLSNLSDGYPWGVWITVDVVIGTAIGCGGYAVGLLTYVLNKGKYHPLVRPAVLTSLLGYGLAVIAVVIDLGRYWALWKVPLFVWRWSHSPQLEVALCVAAYTLVLLIELSPALFERLRMGVRSRVKRFAEGALRILEKNFFWLLALGLLLPTMHQSSLGTMVLLPGPKVHPLWFTPWLPLLFLVNCIIMGFAVVTLEASFSAWVALGWVVFRLAEVTLTGKLGYLGSGYGIAFLAELAVLVAGSAILLSGRRTQSVWQVRAAILLLLGTALHRVNAYLVAFRPGSHFSYFPAVPELLITFGIFAAEIAIYVAVVKTFPILSGATPSPAKT
jgi:Ni/Fe-hydrogenase subunit HybB-like protein